MKEIDPEATLANYSRTKLQCRVDRHRWGRKVSYEMESPRIARRYMGCQDCGTQRWRRVNIHTFEALDNWRYDYASGYRTPGSGLGLIDFQERLYREDFADAVKAGRVEDREDYMDNDEDTPAETVTPIRSKKAS